MARSILMEKRSFKEMCFLVLILTGNCFEGILKGEMHKSSSRQFASAVRSSKNWFSREYLQDRNAFGLLI